MLDPKKISSLVSSIVPFLKVDKGFDSAYVADLAVQLRSVGSDPMAFFTAPSSGIANHRDGQSIVNADWQKMQLLQKAFHDDALETYQTVEQHMVP